MKGTLSRLAGARRLHASAPPAGASTTASTTTGRPVQPLQKINNSAASTTTCRASRRGASRTDKAAISARAGGSCVGADHQAAQSAPPRPFSQTSSPATSSRSAPHLRQPARINELYLSYTKGPFFLRIGRQAFRGASRTRSPCSTRATRSTSRWRRRASSRTSTRRASRSGPCAPATTCSTVGPFSSGFVEAYWVPGFID